MILSIFFVFHYFFNRFQINSDAFQFIGSSIRELPQMKSRVESVKGIKIPYWGRYVESSSGRYRYVFMKVNVVGEKNECSAGVTIVKYDQTWSLEQVIVDNELIFKRQQHRHAAL